MNKVTDKQMEFIPKLTEWLDSKGDRFFLIVRGRRKERIFFDFLLYSVKRKGEYSDEDGEYLNLLSRNYYGEMSDGLRELKAIGILRGNK